jgi:hypothetical protein
MSPTKLPRYDLHNTEIEIFYKSTPSFELIRARCLAEDNWLGANYTKDALVLENHSGYGVVSQLDTKEPMVMAGVFNDGRYPKNVAKMVNRLYTFPEFRMTHTTMTDGFRVSCKLIDALLNINNFEIYLITMQNRPRGAKRWWDTWVSHMNIASNGKWTLGAGYIQTCNAQVQKCWQNYVYYETVPGAFGRWNPYVINDATWQQLPEGL